ncbi:MAG: hypothetical protein WC247_12500 [Porticoccaceae bacterium]
MTTQLRKDPVNPESAQCLQQLSRGRTARRWEIWSQQAQQGVVPCFASDCRFTCGKASCPWWDECQELRVEWRR